MLNSCTMLQHFNPPDQLYNMLKVFKITEEVRNADGTRTGKLSLTI